MLKKASAAGGCANSHPARVFGILLDSNQPASSQAGHNPAHRRRLDLFRGGQFSQSFRAAEDQNRERGEARRAFSGCSILLADTPKKVDSGRMQAIRNNQSG